ncbi:hypothetical protein TI04_11555, partial [Achromatium sp. WMS2]
MNYAQKNKFAHLLAWGMVAIVTLALFTHGISYPTGLRVRGDAYVYLQIARSFTNYFDIITFAGDKTVGFPALEFVVAKSILLFTAHASLLTWINLIG